MTEASQALRTAVAPILERHDLRLYDVELTGAEGRTRTLRVLVQSAGGGPVDLDTITAATQDLSPALDTDRDAAAELRGSYALEVSSPGLERPLRRPEHWHGLDGELVTVKTRAAGTTERLRGTVANVDDTGVELDVDGGRRRVEFSDMTQARTVFEWGHAEKVEQ
ncbi:MAG TPA: ribosome maturation factor RimP [Acidimicrobiia bacterium]|jgi:ribosome maturation factor RimP